MLSIKNLRAYYGSIEALKGINVEVENGSIVCLIGSNGAGKTTLLKSVSGMINRTGSILLDGSEIIKESPRRIAANGVIHVPEGRHVFPGLTVEENLNMGTVSWAGIFGKGGKNVYKDDLEMVYGLFPRLEERAKQLSWSLSGGEQQMLAIGRALMGRPRVLLLDEPSMGLAPVIVQELFETIKEINRTGLTIMLVEQNANMALETADYAYVIEGGRIMLEGNAGDVKHDPRILEAYLGKAHKKD